MRIVKKQHIDDYGTDITPALREVYEAMSAGSDCQGCECDYWKHCDEKDFCNAKREAKKKLAKILEVK